MPLKLVDGSHFPTFRPPLNRTADYRLSDFGEKVDGNYIHVQKGPFGPDWS